MRRPTKAKQIAVPSLAEIRRALRDEAEHASDHLGLRAEGAQRQRPAASSNIVNWWLCWMLTRPPEQRDVITLEGKRIFDLHAASDTPLEFGSHKIRSPRRKRADDEAKRHEA